MDVYVILGIVNLIVLGLLIFEYYVQRKKKSYAIILDKNGEAVDSVKINPSYNKFKHKYEGDEYSYVLPEKTPFVKHLNNKLYFYDFNKTEPKNLIDESDTRINADIFNDLLEMEKIKALNKVGTGLFGKIDKKWIFGGAVVVILIIILINGGV